MKAPKAALAVSVIASFMILIGCAAEPASPELDNASQPVAQPASDTTQEETVPSEETANVEGDDDAVSGIDLEAADPDQFISNLSEVDVSLFESAIRLLDSSYCDRMSGQFQEECRVQVGDEIALNEAKLRNDTSYCSQISTEDGRQACEIKLEAASAAAALPTEEQMAIYNQAVDEKNVELCEKIENREVRDSCVSFIVNPPADIFTQTEVSSESETLVEPTN